VNPAILPTSVGFFMPKTTKTGALCVMTEQGLFAVAIDYLLVAVAALLTLMLAVVRWAYVRDTRKIDESLAGIRVDHHKLIEMVNDINATRPLRRELTDSVEELRKEVADEFSGLRSEIRTDINSFRTDMTTRLDTLIRMQTDKR
jgi:hypothetical protein